MTQRLLGTAMMAAAFVVSSLSGLAQAGRPFTSAFPKEEFAARRLKVADAIGPEAVALVQAAPTVHSSAMFRQSNEFFYLTVSRSRARHIRPRGQSRTCRRHVHP